MPHDVGRLHRRGAQGAADRGHLRARGRHRPAGLEEAIELGWLPGIATAEVLGCFGLSDEVRNGFEAIRVRFTIKGDAPDEKLREIVARAQERSAIYDVLTGGVPVEIEVDTA